MRKMAINIEKSAVAPAIIVETLCHVKLPTMACIAAMAVSIVDQFAWEELGCTWSTRVGYWARSRGMMMAHSCTEAN